MTTSDKIDGIVTNRFLGLPIFFLVMALVYYVSVSTVGGWATDWVNDGVFADGWNFLGISSLHVPAIPELLNNGLEAIHCAAWRRTGIRAADAGAVSLPGIPGGMRIYGTCGFYHGPYFP